MPRTILHLDLDAFFCAVEEIKDPSLRGKAFAVAGRPDQRGVVSSASYAARTFGVHSAMPTSRALRLCPGLLVISGRHHTYSEYSRRVMDQLHNLSGLVEQISIDEAFVDISDLREPAGETARLLQQKVLAQVGLPCSIGVAGSKLVAKVATEVGKKQKHGLGDYPFAITLVEPGTERKFLAGLPVAMLWGVGPKTEKRLNELGLHTIGQLADLGEETLGHLFGEMGRELARHARGEDDRPLSTERVAKSVSAENTFSVDVSDDRTLDAMLKKLSAEVGRGLRRDGLAGSTIRLKLRWPDFTTLTRQTSLPSPTNLDLEIYHAAARLLQDVREKDQAVRLIGVGVTHLGPPVQQLGLFDQESEKARRLQQALDELQARYGRKIIERGK